MNNYVYFKIVNDNHSKGLIVTAETLLQLRRAVDDMFPNQENQCGALHLLKFLEDCYGKIE